MNHSDNSETYRIERRIGRVIDEVNKPLLPDRSQSLQSPASEALRRNGQCFSGLHLYLRSHISLKQSYARLFLRSSISWPISLQPPEKSVSSTTSLRETTCFRLKEGNLEMTCSEKLLLSVSLLCVACKKERACTGLLTST